VEIDKVLKTKVQAASNNLLSQRAIAQENKKVVKAKQTLLSMKSYLQDLKTISKLIEDYQSTTMDSVSDASNEILSKVRQLIAQNTENVLTTHENVNEILSSINLTAARNLEKMKKFRHEKKVNRFNLTQPIV